jgi:hypothetical protein
MDQGQTKRTGNTVVHTMLGTLDGSDAYFRRGDVAASTNWGIGGSLDYAKDGVIYRWVAIGDVRIPWASGPWNAPGWEDGQKYVNKFGVYGINAYADSIETSGQQNTPVTVKQWASLVWLIAAINHDAGRGSEEFLWSMHHREFCTPSYKDCPWPRVYNYTVEYLKAIAQLMAGYEGKTVSDHAVIAKLMIPLHFDLPVQPVTPPHDPIFVGFEKPRSATVVKGATGRQYGNTKAPILTYFQDGQLVPFIGYYHGELVSGSDHWYVVDSPDHERVHQSGVKQWLAVT